MILDTMSNDEVTKEVLYDHLVFASSQTVIRLIKGYNQERIRRKVPKDERYLKFYDIKTKKKNKWLFVVSKNDQIDKYQSTKHISINPYCYYYTNKGLRLFNPHWDDNGEKLIGIDVYNGHLFQRYNERLELGLIDPLAKVKKFIIDNPSSITKIIKRNDVSYTFTKVREGLLLGSIQGIWIVHKTFVNNQLLYEEQLDEEKELLSSFEVEIKEALNENDSIYKSKLTILKGLLG